LSENKAFCLNETSAAVWQVCNGERSVKSISEEAAKFIDAPISEELVWLALEQLATERLVENVEIPVPAFAGMTRRDVIKRVGFSTLVALPIVASMVAPTSVAAQSSCGVCTCDMNGSDMGNYLNGQICGTVTACMTGGCLVCRSTGNNNSPLMDTCFSS
jgi:hypothetical protein